MWWLKVSLILTWYFNCAFFYYVLLNLVLLHNKLHLNYIPESSVSSNFSRYGEIPIDISTGVPKIEIPIYTVKYGSLEVPISFFSYHASGIKVCDVFNEAEIRWVLNCGGIISWQIQRVPDDHRDSQINF